jgi:asparagine synthase (glutamine-hydrolysing)
MLTKVDRMSMANSLEVRVPLLDHKIVEFAASLPSEFKANLFHTKRLFKRTTREFLPQRTIAKKKMGFEIPLHKWVNQKMMDFIHDILNEDGIRAQGIFQWEEVDRLVWMFGQSDEEFSSKLSRRKVNLRFWTLLSFQIWYKNFFR